MKQTRSSFGIARRTVLLLGLVAALALSALTWLLATDAGTRAATGLLQRALPQLALEGVDGNLLRGLRIDRLRWRDHALDLAIDALSLELSTPDLRRRKIGISRLHIARLSLDHHPPADRPPSGPPRLPRLHLPMTLAIDELGVEQLTLRQDQQALDLEALRLGLHWQGERVHLRSLHFNALDSQVQARGQIALHRYYPLRLQLQVSHEAVQLDNRFSGDLARLYWQLQSSGAAEVSADFIVQPLSPQLTTQASLQLQTPLTTPAGELKQLSLQARGELLGELAARLSAQLDLGQDPEDEPLTLTARGRYRERTLTLEPLQAHHRGQRLQARCHWPDLPEEALTCRGKLGLTDLQPWLAEPELQLLADWQLVLVATGDPGLELALTTREGRWAGHPLSAALQLQATADSIHFNPSRLQLGDNALRFQGQLAPRHNDLALALKAAELAQLHPALEGRLDGALQLEGRLDRLHARGRLVGSALAWADSPPGSLQLDLDLREAMYETSHLSLAAAGPGNLHLELRGRRDQHRLNLHAEEPELAALDLACDGNWSQGDPGRWLLACGQFDLQGQGDWAALQLALVEPLTLSWRPAQNALKLSPFCLRDEEAANLCLRQPLTWRAGHLQPIQASLHRWSLAWLDALLPENWATTPASRLDGELNLTSLQPLELSAALTATTPGLRWTGIEEGPTLLYQQIRATLQAGEDALNATLTAHSDALGDLTARVDVARLREDRELQGRLELERLDLASLSWLLPSADALSGQVAGAVGLAGSTRSPRVHGQLALSEGRAVLPILPHPLELALQTRFDAHRGQLDGHFHSGDGRGHIDGELLWPDEGPARFTVHFDARDLTLAPLPDSSLVVHPQLQLQWNAEGRPGLGLTGELPVERARIAIGELPASAVQSSADVVLMDEPEQERSTPLPLWARVGIDLGEDFQFQGFGANARLAGQLELDWTGGTPPRARGEVTIPQGRYRAYGQRLAVRRGSLLFDGDLRSPDLDLEVIRDLQRRDVTVGLRITGTPQHPHAQLFSDPAMPETSMAYYLLTGQPPPSGAPGGEFAGEGMLLSLGLAGAESPAAHLAERLGVQDLQLGTTAGEHGTEAQISASLGTNLHVRYGVSLEQDASSLTVQYQLTPKLFLEAVSGLDSALDLIYTFERQRRGNRADKAQGEQP